MNAIAIIPEQFIFSQDNILTTTSIKVAEAFGKRHDHVMRDIKKIIESTKEIDHAPKFGEMVVEVEIGSGAKRNAQAYSMDKDGFMLVVMGYTGAAAMAIKLAYINAFNTMAAQLLGKRETVALPEPLTITKPQQGELFTRVNAIAGDSKKIRAAIWSRFQNHYHLNSYKNLPADQYGDALVYLERLKGEYAIEGEVVQKQSEDERIAALVEQIVSKKLPMLDQPKDLATKLIEVPLNMGFIDNVLKRYCFRIMPTDE